MIVSFKTITPSTLLVYFLLHTKLVALVSAESNEVRSAISSDQVNAQTAPSFTPADDEEAARNLETRIIGGTDAKAGDFPWFARATLYNHNEWGGCGGMLVAKEFVLTAAHCIDNEFINNGGYMIGALCSPYTQNSNCGQKLEKFAVQKVYKHPNYNSSTTNMDFTLVKLNGSSSITPVPIDQGNISTNYASGKALITLGLGDTNPTNQQSFPRKVKYVQVGYKTPTQCKNKYGSNQITSAMLCASASGKDSCQGDSGGPLYDKANNVMVGVVSWGYDCADPNYPGVYSRIANQFTWIKNTICNNHTPSTAPSFCEGGGGGGGGGGTDGTNSDLIIQVKTDKYGSQDNKWILKKKNSSGQFVIVKRRTWFANFRTKTDKLSYPSDSCFLFTMYDKFGDGLCCKQGSGYFSVNWNGTLIKKSGMNGRKQMQVRFGSCGKK
jgi:V8-like Glu-specific endopeptidase